MMNTKDGDTFLQRHGNWVPAMRQAGVLTIISIVLGLALWLVRSDRLPLSADPDVYALNLPVPLVSSKQARKLYDEGSHFFVDTRRGDAQDRATIPGAFVIREASFADDLDDVMDFIYPEDHLILFGESSPLPVTAVAVRFIDRGYHSLRILQGGLRAWVQERGPLSDGDPSDE